MNTKTKVVIVGGGFGGVYTARHLDRLFRDDEIEITIINKNNYFLFTPLLHEVATGGLTPDSIIEPIREI
ncbi:MAG TPA: FAD-dependent oxidoreductase, partial [Candidatus Paceibacterota bacterium]